LNFVYTVTKVTQLNFVYTVTKATQLNFVSNEAAVLTSEIGIKSFFLLLLISTLHCKGKSKVIPLEAWTDPEGSRRLRIPDFKTI